MKGISIIHARLLLTNLNLNASEASSPKIAFSVISEKLPGMKIDQETYWNCWEWRKKYMWCRELRAFANRQEIKEIALLLYFWLC